MLPPVNYLSIEILTVIYLVFLVFIENLYILAIPALLYLKRLIDYRQYINKAFLPNITILTVYILLFTGLFLFKDFKIFGVLFGLLQYTTYIYHESAYNLTYKWFEPVIDIPMLLISGYVADLGLQENNLVLAPILGDFIYHVLEIVNN